MITSFPSYSQFSNKERLFPLPAYFSDSQRQSTKDAASEG